ARVDFVEGIAMALARNRDGFPYGLETDQPVRIVMLVVGNESLQHEHVRVLGSVARLLKDPAFREKILDTLDVTTVVRLLGLPRKGVSRRKARPLSHLLLSYARKIGRELGVNAIIVSTESGEELAPLKRLPGRAAFIVATSSRHIAEDAEKLVRRVLLLPQVP